MELCNESCYSAGLDVHSRAKGYRNLCSHSVVKLHEATRNVCGV